MLDDADVQTADYIVHQLDLTKFLNFEVVEAVDVVAEPGFAVVR